MSLTSYGSLTLWWILRSDVFSSWFDELALLLCSIMWILLYIICSDFVCECEIKKSVTPPHTHALISTASLAVQTDWYMVNVTLVPVTRFAVLEKKIIRRNSQACMEERVDIKEDEELIMRELSLLLLGAVALLLIILLLLILLLLILWYCRFSSSSSTNSESWPDSSQRFMLANVTGGEHEPICQRACGMAPWKWPMTCQHTYHQVTDVLLQGRECLPDIGM